MLSSRVVTVFFRAVLAVFLCLTLVLPVYAQLDSSTKVRMAYVEFPPYSSTDSHGRAQGLSIDLARRLTETEGLDLEFVHADNPGEMISMLQSGAADMTSLLALTDQRLNVTLATKPIGTFQSRLFTKKRWGKVKTTDFAGETVGVVRGSFGLLAAEEVPLARVVEYPSQDALLVSFLSGGVAAVVTDSDSFLAQLRQMGVDALVETVEPPLTEVPYGLLISKRRPDLQATLNQSLAENISRHDLKVLTKVWFGRPTWLAEHYLILFGSGFMLLIALGTGQILRKYRFQSRRADALFQESEANRLLIDALDGVDAAIVIYDKSFRAVHWNKGFARTFTRMISTLKMGASLHNLIAISYLNGTTSDQLTAREADAFAANIVARLKAGETVSRIVQAANGRVFDATEFPVGEHHYASVRVDVTRLTQQAELIQSQKVDLETQNDQLQMFAAVAAHDLKAPLAQQVSLLQFINDDLDEADVELPADVQEYLGILSTLSLKMKRLVQDLLNHAQADFGPDRSERFSPTERISDIVHLAGLPPAFKVEIAQDMPKISVDPISFDTVIRNLVSNAAKHHDCDQGLIRIRGHKTDKAVTVEIEDDGPGIPERYRKSIFEPFKRLSAKVDGSGLGLSFIKNAVTHWGGDVHVECAQSRGSTFVLTIPDRPKVSALSSSH